jgi:rubrerythrin
VTYNAGEVLEIARQIERNGARFYRRAAETAPTSQAERALLDLAVMEEKHEQTFADMAAELSAEERQAPLYDPNDEARQYLQAVAGGQVFDLKADPAEWLEGGRTLTEVLARAMELEKDSIIYYLALKPAIPEGLGRARVDDVIREEMRHLVLLNTMSEAAAGG